MHVLFYAAAGLQYPYDVCVTLSWPEMLRLCIFETYAAIHILFKLLKPPRGRVCVLERLFRLLPSQPLDDVRARKRRVAFASVYRRKQDFHTFNALVYCFSINFERVRCIDLAVCQLLMNATK